MRVLRLRVILDGEHEEKAIRHITQQVAGWGGKVLRAKSRKPRRKEKKKYKKETADSNGQK